MTIQQIASELGWTIRPGTRMRIDSFVKVLLRLDPPQEKVEHIKALKSFAGTIARDQNGLITIKID